MGWALTAVVWILFVVTTIGRLGLAHPRASWRKWKSERAEWKEWCRQQREIAEREANEK